jgi:hypothetical protein
MEHSEIDRILESAESASAPVDPELLRTISTHIRGSLRPVRPLLSSRALASRLLFISVAVAFASAALLGLHGIRKLSLVEDALIFPILAVMTWLSAQVSAAGMAPGSRRRAAPGTVLLAASLSIVAVFALLFHDYRTERFVPQGLACLIAGLVVAVPAAAAGWLLLRRGYAVNRTAAGLAMGTLASLAGVTMLELHCANFEAWHVMVWHTAVIPVSAAAGALIARMSPARRGQVR